MRAEFGLATVPMHLYTGESMSYLPPVDESTLVHDVIKEMNRPGLA
jgi:hypothetical protein